jgi:CDGSH-type Zn-finger protein
VSTYSVRCRFAACRHRRVINRHPETYLVVPRCRSCGQRRGWRIELRTYNQLNLCGCGKSPLYPHRKGKYKYCDFHPHGPYNQAKRQGVHDEDIPLEFMGKQMRQTESCPF